MRKRYKYKVVKAGNNTSFVVGDGNMFALEYIEGEITEGVKGSIGVMVFNKLSQAEHFIQKQRHHIYRSTAKILRVIPIGRGKTVNKVSLYVDEKGLSDYYRYYYKLNPNHTSAWEAPDGTMCYPAVFVVK